MNRMLIQDYMRRYGPAFLSLVIFYAFFFWIEARDENGLLLYSSWLALGVMVYYSYADFEQNQATKVILTLPIHREEYGRTLWVEAVLIPLITGSMVFWLGMAAMWITVPTIFSHWTWYVIFLNFGTPLAYGYFVWMFQVRWQDEDAKRSFRYWIGLVATGAGYLWFLLKEQENSLLQIVLLVISLLIFMISYRLAPRILLTFAQPKMTSVENVAPVRDLSIHEMTLRGWERWMANPFRFLTLGSMLLLTMMMAVIISLRSPVVREWHPQQKLILLAVMLMMFLFGMVFRILNQRGVLLGSLRLLGSLPVPRYRLALRCLAIPFVTLLPLAALPLFFGIKALVIYLAATACWLALDVVYMRWHKMASVCAVNVLLIAYGCWPWLHNAMARQNRPDLVAWVDGTGVAITLVIILASVIWTWRLIHYSNLPYRPKPSARFTCG